MCSNTVIPALYEETRRGVVKELSDTAYVVLTSDRWTSRATESFLTAHYITLVTVNNYLFLAFVTFNPTVTMMYQMSDCLIL